MLLIDAGSAEPSRTWSWPTPRRKVLDDVLDGYVTAGQALADYGLAIAAYGSA